MYIRRLSLGSVFLILVISCTNRSSTYTQIPTSIRDTCKLDLSQGSDLESKAGCRSCHAQRYKRILPNVPAFPELSAIDSLKLSDFIFKSKHKSYYLKESALREQAQELASLTDCERKNLLHYIKDYNRSTKHILWFPKKDTNTLN